MSPVRATPKSRAYWELKAEQVMNRVFAPEASIQVEILDGVQPLVSSEVQPLAAPARPATTVAPVPPGPPVPPAPAPTAPAPGRLQRRLARLLGNPPQALMAGCGVLALALAGTSVAGVSLWNQHQQALRQERNLLLIERLRSLAAADGAPATAEVAQTNGQAASGAGSDLPPPPPDEPWMQELATLPQGSAPPARVLQVPMNDRVGAPAPPASTSSAPRPAAGGSNGAGGGGSGGSGGSLPQLVGVIQAGRSGSAIFQLNGSSTSAAVGESIGSSGWRLRSANGDSAVIERGGEQRQVSISSGF